MILLEETVKGFEQKRDRLDWWFMNAAREV